MDIWMVIQYESYQQMVINLRNKTVKLQSCLYIELKLKIGLFKYFIKEFIDSTLLFSPVVWTFLGTEKREKRVIELTKSRTLLDYYCLSIKKLFLLETKGRNKGSGLKILQVVGSPIIIVELCTWCTPKFLEPF